MIKLLALALALVMVLSLTACGGKTDPAPSGSGTTDPGTSQQEPSSSKENPDARYDFYLTDAQLEKIDSLGKSEENKTIVAQSVYDGYVKITVYTWSDSAAKFDDYAQYFVFNPGSRYASHLADYGSGYNILEQNDTDEWFCIGLKDDSSVGQIGLQTYEDILNYCQNGTGGDHV